MIRLVPGPDGMIVPDLAEKLPGRGIWIDADRSALVAACESGALYRGLSRSLKTRVGPERLPADFVSRLEALLLARVRARLGLMNKAGAVVAGFEKVRERLRRGDVALLMSASDSAPDSRRKLLSGSGGRVPVCDLLDRMQLGLAFGRENVVQAAVIDGGGVKALRRELERLASWLGRKPYLDVKWSETGDASRNEDRPTGRSEE